MGAIIAERHAVRGVDGRWLTRQMTGVNEFRYIWEYERVLRHLFDSKLDIMDVLSNGFEGTFEIVTVYEVTSLI